MDGWDFSDMDNFSQDLLKMAQGFENGKHAKKFLKKSGNQLRKKTVQLAKQRVNKKTGNLFEGIKRGKPYKYYVDGSMAVRIYAGRPANHAHLINDGHRIVDKSGNEHGFVHGKRFFEDGSKEYEDDYYKGVEGFIDEMLDEHGM